MTDPFDVLRLPESPIHPSADVAATLRQRLADALSNEDPHMPTNQPITPPSPDAALEPILNTVVPYLCVNAGADAIAYYVAAFGAVEVMRMVGDDGRLGHAELRLGNSTIMLADEYPEVGVLAPSSRGGTSTSFSLRVANVDAAFAKAVELGGTVVRPVSDQFYGERAGWLTDPFGHQWTLSTPIPGYTAQQYQQSAKESGFDLVEPPAAS